MCQTPANNTIIVAVRDAKYFKDSKEYNKKSIFINSKLYLQAGTSLEFRMTFVFNCIGRETELADFFHIFSRIFDF